MIPGFGLFGIGRKKNVKRTVSLRARAVDGLLLRISGWWSHAHVGFGEDGVVDDVRGGGEDVFAAAFQAIQGDDDFGDVSAGFGDVFDGFDDLAAGGDDVFDEDDAFAREQFTFDGFAGAVVFF